ncbi:MAG: M56 family metallopeptidase [Cyanobacteria bacterium P01_F01_bin.42]
MHLLMILLSIGIAWLLRLSWGIFPRHPILNEAKGIVLMIAPSLFVLMTSVSIVWMGPDGMGLPMWEGWLSYGMAIAFLGYAIALGIRIWSTNRRFVQHVKTLPSREIQGYACRILETPSLYSALCGIGTAEIVISRGLLDSLDSEHVAAVLAHEQAHAHFNDVLHYAILAWLRRILPLFPYSSSIWKVLILNREVRADRWATQWIEPLVLAESLLAIAQSPQPGFSTTSPLIVGTSACDGLSLRIKALIEPEVSSSSRFHFGLWLWIIVACCPLLMVPFHH